MRFLYVFLLSFSIGSAAQRLVEFGQRGLITGSDAISSIKQAFGEAPFEQECRF